MIEHRDEHLRGLVCSLLVSRDRSGDLPAIHDHVPGSSDRVRGLGRDGFGFSEQPDRIAKPFKVHPVMLGESDHVNPPRDPFALPDVLPVGVSHMRRAGLLLDRHEPIGVHDDGRFPGTMGVVAMPGVLDTVADFDGDVVFILQPRNQCERSRIGLSRESDRVFLRKLDQGLEPGVERGAHPD